MPKEIENREDLSLLIHSFYAKIRKNEEIGSFFNETIHDWDKHLEKLTDFWETNLFPGRKYFGNPIEAHIKVDEKFNNSIEPTIFGLWLNIWFETLDELFVGENADILKRRARKMGTFLMINIYENRKKD